MACLCSMISETSAGKTQTAGHSLNDSRLESCPGFSHKSGTKPGGLDGWAQLVLPMGAPTHGPPM